MQTALSLDTKKLNLMQAIMEVDTEAILDKVAKYFVRVSKDVEKKQELSAETLAMMEQSRKEYSEGQVISFDSSSECQKWLESL